MLIYKFIIMFFIYQYILGKGICFKLSFAIDPIKVNKFIIVIII